jgi:transcriptional regulator GlxA family with amidase domain
MSAKTLINPWSCRLQAGSNRPGGGPPELLVSRDDNEKRIGLSIAYMKEHLGHPQNVSAMAAQAGVSLSHYFVLFRRHTGCSPLKYFIGLRMNQAAHLLETTTLNIGQIGLALGYEDAFYFSRAFKSFQGTSPSGYRMRAGIPGTGRGNAVRKSAQSLFC